ncbi:unnamed protein product [Symbiodinium sp. KB8]|nr:unnamed protein product [Symbiodinium sp. KB8]
MNSVSAANISRISKRLDKTANAFRRTGPGMVMDMERTVVRQDTLAAYRRSIAAREVAHLQELAELARAGVAALEQRKAAAAKERRRLSSEVAAEVATSLSSTEAAHQDTMRRLEQQREEVAAEQSALDEQLAQARRELEATRQAEEAAVVAAQGSSASAPNIAALRVARVEGDAAEARVRELTSMKRDLVVQLADMQAKAAAFESSSTAGGGAKRPRAGAPVSQEVQDRHQAVELKREIAALRAKLGVQRQVLAGEKVNPRGKTEVEAEFAADLAAASGELGQAASLAEERYAAEVETAVMVPALLACLWDAEGQGDAATAAGRIFDAMAAAEGQLLWDIAARDEVGDDAAAGLALLTAAGVVTEAVGDDGAVLQWGAGVQ